MATPRWSRFSLRSLMLAVTLVAVATALYVRFAPQWRLAREWTARGGKVTFHDSLFGLPIPSVPGLRDVRSVDLSRHPITENDLAAMSQLPRLESLYLARCGLTSETLGRLGRLRHLKRLALWGTTLHDEQVTALGQLQDLEVLDIHETKVTEACLETLHRLPSLKMLKFDAALSDRGIKWLTKMNIQPFDEWKLRDVSDTGLRDLEAWDLTNAKLSQLATTTATDDGILRLCRQLRPSTFNGCRLSLGGRQFTPRCLEGIPWTEVSGVLLDGTSVGVSDVAKRIGTQIVQLDVGHAVVVHRGVCRPFNRKDSPCWIATLPQGDWLDESATWMPTVQYLSLYKAPTLPVRGVLRRYSSIRHVSTYGPLPADFVEELSHLPQLESLEIAWNEGVEPQPLEPLKQLQNLKRLRFTATPFSAEQIRVLGELPALRELELHSCHFDRDVIEAFPNFRQLSVRMSRASKPNDQIEEFGRSDG